jgi:hypothetical protein
MTGSGLGEGHHPVVPVVKKWNVVPAVKFRGIRMTAECGMSSVQSLMPG